MANDGLTFFVRADHLTEKDLQQPFKHAAHVLNLGTGRFSKLLGFLHKQRSGSKAREVAIWF